MATHTFTFDTDAEGFSLISADPGWSGMWDGSEGDPSVGSLQLAFIGDGISGDAEWRWVGTWEELGVAADTTVTDVTISVQRKGDISGFDSGSDYCFTEAAVRRSDTNVVIAQAFKEPTASYDWESDSDAGVVPASHQPSDSTIRISFFGYFEAFSAGGVSATLRADTITIETTHTDPGPPTETPTVVITNPDSDSVETNSPFQWGFYCDPIVMGGTVTKRANVSVEDDEILVEVEIDGSGIWLPATIHDPNLEGTLAGWGITLDADDYNPPSVHTIRARCSNEAGAGNTTSERMWRVAVDNNQTATVNGVGQENPDGSPRFDLELQVSINGGAYSTLTTELELAQMFDLGTSPDDSWEFRVINHDLGTTYDIETNPDFVESEPPPSGEAYWRYRIEHDFEEFLDRGTLDTDGPGNVLSLTLPRDIEEGRTLLVFIAKDGTGDPSVSDTGGNAWANQLFSARAGICGTDNGINLGNKLGSGDIVTVTLPAGETGVASLHEFSRAVLPNSVGAGGLNRFGDGTDGRPPIGKGLGDVIEDLTVAAGQFLAVAFWVDKEGASSSPHTPAHAIPGVSGGGMSGVFDYIVDGEIAEDWQWTWAAGTPWVATDRRQTHGLQDISFQDLMLDIRRCEAEVSRKGWETIIGAKGW